MQQTEQPNSRNRSQNKKFFPTAMLCIVLGAIILSGVLYWLSRAFNVLTERYQFLAQSGLNLLIFIGIVVQALIYRRQWDSMQEGLSQTDRVIEKMQAQLEAIGRQEEFMRGQLKAMKDQGRLIGQQIELVVMSEGAYLRLREWETPRFDNDFLILQARIMNGGRTPAWGIFGHSRVGVDYQPVDPFPRVPPDEESWPNADSCSAIAAGDDAVLPFTPLHVTDAQIKLVHEGKMHIFVDGVCRYFDSLGGKQFYTYGFTLKLQPSGIFPRYERHHRVKIDGENPN